MNWDNLIRMWLADSESPAMNLRAVLQQVPDPREAEKEYAMSQASDHNDAVGFVIIAVLGVMVIIALNLI
jgi:hypothetical protein